ncbi:MAG: hypothetical protein ACHQ1G_02535 [Planctomycetota bacterium]|jgi:hypothetical protein
MPHLPVEDPFDHGSLVDRSRQYVRASPALRIALVVNAVDHIAALVLVAINRVSPEVAGVFALFSVLTWYFAVCVPVMNRTVRSRLGAQETGYWGEVVEMAGRVVICFQTVLYTAAVVCGAALGLGS